MPVTRRTTPCVGICSTTYGDLVCRGCKRFAHEIVGWNGFAQPQRDAVWERLRALREGSVLDYLRVVDAPVLRACAAQFRVPEFEVLSDALVAYEVLSRSRSSLARLADLGLELRAHEQSVELTAELVRLIDQEFFRRSRAHYERNYRIAAQ
jgi:predicted Fe-S protein YdhL (DUF1289 family)